MSPSITLYLVICGSALLIAAALHDAAARTIPNWMPAGLATAGLVLRLRHGDLLLSLAIASLLFAGLWTLWLRGWMGGGDVKLIPAASLSIIPQYLPQYVLFVALAGGILALVYLALSNFVRRPRPGNPRNFVARIVKAEAWRMHRRGPLPYAVAITTGALPFIFKNLSE